MRKTRIIGHCRRINALYREASLSQALGRWKRLENEESDLLKHARPTKEDVSRFGEYRTSFLRRMWNSSAFMRTFKQHFTMSFNGRRDHRGTMFEGRYHGRNHKPKPEIMWRTSAYIDINAWEAGIVKRPEDYAWCSFAAAVKGDEKARRDYAFMYGNADDRDVIRDCHVKSMREAMSEVLVAREAERAEREAKGTPASGRRANLPPPKADPGQEMPKQHVLKLERGDLSVVERILVLLSGRADEASGTSRDGRNQEPNSLQPVLPRAAAREGADRPHRPRSSELAAAGV